MRIAVPPCLCRPRADEIDQKTGDGNAAKPDEEGGEAGAVAVRGQIADHRFDERIDEGTDIEGADRAHEQRSHAVLPALAQGDPAHDAILDGRWDNAEVEVWRVNWASVDQRVLMRRGNLGDIRRGRTSFVAEVRSLTHWLNQTVGRTYQFSCDADLGDARCGVNLASPLWSVSGTVASLTGSRSFTAAALGSFAADTLTLGVITWTTGANAGRKVEIASFASGAITLFQAPVRPIALGDAFTATAGCDKQFATCAAKCGNGVNCRGFPHMPGEEAVLRYPNQGDANNGAPLT